ncbi:hypothetical protein FOH10_30575 [Nocardia otitidiscaviarum]|uniref:Polyketide cyclase / dehydrase and lipid transport n=1 Tax=Nocardia otitidiscaviarum TaxID=1823 RepID=A0A516NU32_9NOCA|nr:hypothetical protein [Nocardia otitidiscaviarum]MCP9621796.1 hypothetical protein [Nocardia otitidiscaviarum]QDP82426.1 hypothetical protein FOH10_30575 [Nocardia otitidiscaviarum]
MTPGQVWGADSGELAARMPCDSLISGPSLICDRAVAIDAPPSVVFAWLCQLRKSPYSYDLLDNFGRRSPRVRDPELTNLAVGQRFMGAFDLVDFTPGEHITLGTSHVAVTYAVRVHADAGSRLHVRVLFRGPRVITVPLAFGDFVMMRKQLLTLKELAEREARAAA